MQRGNRGQLLALGSLIIASPLSWGRSGVKCGGPARVYLCGCAGTQAEVTWSAVGRCCRLRLRALTQDSGGERSVLLSDGWLRMQVFFFLFAASMCVPVCALGQDQLSKSTLERVAQSSSPTHIFHPDSPPPAAAYVPLLQVHRELK